MRPRNKIILCLVLPFLFSFGTMYYLRLTNRAGVFNSDQYFTSGYKGCFIPDMKDTSTEDFKTVFKDQENYLYLNPAKTGKIKIESLGPNIVKITSDEETVNVLTICPEEVVARLSIYQVDLDHFSNPKTQNSAGKFKTTFEGKEPVETTIDEKKAAYIRLENFPSN